MPHDAAQTRSPIVHDHLYDYPKYYDLVFASDWKAEFHFLQQCIAKHAQRPVRRMFEPACGTGRLLIKLASAGFEVSGNDLNQRAIDFCNDRLQRHGFPATAVVGDMSAFRLPRRVDAAYNMINSFRHLQNEQLADDHLKCVERSLAKGGLYILGLHLTPTRGARVEDERWLARRGSLTVESYMWSKELDLRRRQERLGMSFDVRTPTRTRRIVDEMIYRTYTAAQMERLLKKRSALRVVATYDFLYDIEAPIDVGPESEDVVYVLEKS